MDDFVENMENDELDATFNYFHHIVNQYFIHHHMSDEMIDETVDGFIDFFLKEKAVYNNIQEYYTDQGEVSWELIEEIVEEEWEARQEQKAESEEFSAYRYRL